MCYSIILFMNLFFIIIFFNTWKIKVFDDLSKL